MDFVSDEVIKVKRVHPDAVLPCRQKPGDTGYDVTAIDDGVWSDDRTYIEYDTGIAVQLPEGYDVKLFPRSSISKTDLVLANGVATIDNNYRGTLRCRFKCVPRCGYTPGSYQPKLYKKGDRVAQMVLQRVYTLPIVEVPELSDTDRGDGGFGSTGA